MVMVAMMAVIMTVVMMVVATTVMVVVMVIGVVVVMEMVAILIMAVMVKVNVMVHTGGFKMSNSSSDSVSETEFASSLSWSLKKIPSPWVSSPESS